MANRQTAGHLESAPVATLARGDGADVGASFLEPRASVSSRLAAGKALREQVPRESLGAYSPDPKRADPVAMLEEQNRTRLRNLVPVRHARMLTSPFGFFRGSAVVMAADLARSPVTGLTVQACGDMHVSNFGVFGSAERNLVFSINDFDETLPAPWEWDLKRLTASAAVAAGFLGGSRRDADDAVRAATHSYGKRIREYAHMGYLETWYSSIDEKDILRALDPDMRKRARKGLAKARGRTHLQVLEKMADLVDDQLRIIEEAPLLVHETHSEAGRPIREALGILLRSYLESLSWDRRVLLGRYRIIDFARKVVGVGSVGMRCWVILLTGAADDDPLFLQVKEAQPSVLRPHVGMAMPFTNEGRRVVSGQRLIQGSPDIFLGWGEVDGKEFYVRQLRDMKGSAEIEPGRKLSDLVAYCRLCGSALALAHAKSGDAAAIAGYVGKSDVLADAMVEFAAAYADQTSRDYDALVAAAERGRIEVAGEA